MPVRIARAGREFSSWTELLDLLQAAFAYMKERIDPPSSVNGLTSATLAAKAREETLFVAIDDDDLVGCVFVRPRGESLYVSKLAVRADRQGNGIGRRLMDAVDDHARGLGLRTLALDTRIELTENHETFAALGFVRAGLHAHDGYDRPTFVAMRREVKGSR
jgi:GNAT superfamily N-acetyltransferase